MLDNLRGNIRKIAFSLLGLLGALFVYTSYIQVVQGDYLAGHPLNRRALAAAEKIERGRITDRHGEVLAESKRDEAGKYTRHYPYGAIAAHVVGYSSARYGNSALESVYNGYLSGFINPERRFGPITKLWPAEAGNSLTLTLDADLQEAAYRALGNRRGAVVALDPRTGAILAMVSRPGFDPENIDRNWSEVSTAPAGPLVNRALQGLYPPGSVLKVMIAEAALAADPAAGRKKTYDCAGSLRIGPDYVLNEAGRTAHGKVDLEDALTVSCNVTFGRLALELGRAGMSRTFERYAFARTLDAELQEAASRLPDFGHLGDGDLAQTAIGQGSLLVTPLRMAMLAAVFANHGVMMKPYLVSKITAPDGAAVKQFAPAEFASPAAAAQADRVAAMMLAVVAEGTGRQAAIRGVKVAGKTGTAENPHGQPHAWFIGFAPFDKPQIAIAVIVENGGGGGAVAAPVARQVIAKALR